MPYIKGESGNPAGRPKGSKNRSTTAIREMLSFLIEEIELSNCCQPSKRKKSQ